MKQNPCRYCALSYERKGRHYPSYEEKCGKCEHIKVHVEYLKSKRMFERGEQIKDFDELMNQQRVFVGYADKSMHIEAVKSWQVRIILDILARGNFYKAIRKKVEPVDAGESED